MHRQATTRVVALQVDEEDYDQAKVLKDKILELQKAGSLIADLERRKQETVGLA